MGDKKRMGDRYQTSEGKIRLFTRQQDAVLRAIERDGYAVSREVYVSAKYGESAPIFLTGYRWYVREAQKLVKRPEKAEFPYWSFAEPRDAESSGGGTLLELEVPLDEAVFFDMADWTKILNLSYIGESPEEEKKFAEELEYMGLNNTKVMLGAFYPALKNKITDSWQRLFRHHEAIKSGDYSNIHSIEAGLWMIKKEWIVNQG